MKPQNKPIPVPRNFESLDILLPTPDLFRRFGNGLMVPFGYIYQKKAQILLDSGSFASNINENFCKHHKISIEPKEQMSTMANQAVQTLKTTTNPVIVQITEYREKLDLAVCS